MRVNSAINVSARDVYAFMETNDEVLYMCRCTMFHVTLTRKKLRSTTSEFVCDTSYALNKIV